MSSSDADPTSSSVSQSISSLSTAPSSVLPAAASLASRKPMPAKAAAFLVKLNQHDAQLEQLEGDITKLVKEDMLLKLELDPLKKKLTLHLRLLADIEMRL